MDEKELRSWTKGEMTWEGRICSMEVLVERVRHSSVMGATTWVDRSWRKDDEASVASWPAVVVRMIGWDGLAVLRS